MLVALRINVNIPFFCFTCNDFMSFSLSVPDRKLFLLLFICVCVSSPVQAESRDLPEEACGGGEQMETGLYPQTQSSTSP